MHEKLGHTRYDNRAFVFDMPHHNAEVPVGVARCCNDIDMLRYRKSAIALKDLAIAE